MLVVGGSEMTVKVLPALGFQLCGVVTRFARPVRPFRRLLGQKLSVRAGAQFGRSLLWTWQARAARTEGWTTKRIDAGQLESAAIAWPRPPEGTAIFERNAETMAYFLRCPVTPITLYSVQKGAVRGYFVLAQTPAQSRIADFYVNSEVREDWRALIELAVAQSMQDPGVTEVAAMGSDPVTRQALMEAGFHARGDSEMRILTRKGVAVPAGPIRFQLIDYDGAYLHDNRTSNWA